MSRAPAVRSPTAAPWPATGKAAPVLATVMALLLSSCGGKSGDAGPGDTLTTRARQEAMGRSGIPGAIGINRALEVADTATARQAELDSLIRSR